MAESLHKGYLLACFLSPLMAGLFWEVKTKKAQGLCTVPTKRKSSSGGGERGCGSGEQGCGGGEQGWGGGKQVSKTSQTLETSSVPSLLFFIAGPPRPGSGGGGGCCGQGLSLPSSDFTAVQSAKSRDCFPVEPGPWPCPQWAGTVSLLPRMGRLVVGYIFFKCQRW